uniref:Activating signal cointegrator 1 complex subunit 1-like n=1 Tax=Hirondellea gigas TaxID=1518452 RepID=A0A2P2I2Y0_9CRUS
MSAPEGGFDVLKPPTYWVGNRCYRVLTHQVENSNYGYTEKDDYSDEDVYNDEAEGEGGDYDFLVEQIKHGPSNGKFRTSWYVSSVYYPFIIGSKGATRKRLEQESGCSIVIPPRGTNGDIVVIGNSVRKVRTGRLKVVLLIEQSHRKIAPTHFISIPTNQPHIQDNFTKFKARVLGVCGNDRGVTEQLFQEVGRLHLTVAVLAAVDDVDRKAAVEALKKSVQESASLHGGYFRLRLRGLHYFNDDPSEVAVLYAGLKHDHGKEVSNEQCKLEAEGDAHEGLGGASETVDRPFTGKGGASKTEGGPSAEIGGPPQTENCGEEKLDSSPDSFQNFADFIMNSMIKSGVVNPQHDKVKLHVTLLNTSFLLRNRDEDQAEYDNSRTPAYKRGPKVTFDARAILQNFSDYDFGVLEVREVQLSVMHTRDSNTGYYTATTTVPLTP